MPNEIVNCETCGGAGFVTEIDLGCCGNLTRGGECRGDCAVPVEIQKSCGCCGGHGVIIEQRRKRQ